MKAYTPKIKPAHPIVDLLRPSSLSQRLKLLAINTQGKPLIAPNKRILTLRISLYTALGLWLRENDFSRTQVGFISLIGITYGFNWLWAPIIDRIQIPMLTKKLGHRRGWIVLMQLIILLSLIVWSVINPTENLALLITVGLIIAIASATQDITCLLYTSPSPRD